MRTLEFTESILISGGMKSSEDVNNRSLAKVIGGGILLFVGAGYHSVSSATQLSFLASNLGYGPSTYYIATCLSVGMAAVAITGFGLMIIGITEQPALT